MFVTKLIRLAVGVLAAGVFLVVAGMLRSEFAAVETGVVVVLVAMGLAALAGAVLKVLEVVGRG